MVPSIIPCAMSASPDTISNTPRPAQRWNRLKTVFQPLDSPGRFHQGEAVRAIHKTTSLNKDSIRVSQVLKPVCPGDRREESRLVSGLVPARRHVDGRMSDPPEGRGLAGGS